MRVALRGSGPRVHRIKFVSWLPMETLQRAKSLNRAADPAHFLSRTPKVRVRPVSRLKSPKSPTFPKQRRTISSNPSKHIGENCQEVGGLLQKQLCTSCRDLPFDVRVTSLSITLPRYELTLGCTQRIHGLDCDK